MQTGFEGGKGRRKTVDVKDRRGLYRSVDVGQWDLWTGQLGDVGRGNGLRSDTGWKSFTASGGRKRVGVLGWERPGCAMAKLEYKMSRRAWGWL